MTQYSHATFLAIDDVHLDPPETSTDEPEEGVDFYVCEYCSEEVDYDTVNAKHIDTGLCEDCYADQYEQGDEMADIEKCTGLKCPHNTMECHRYTAVEGEHWQSWNDFSFHLDKNGKCEHYWDNAGYMKDLRFENRSNHD